MSDTFGKLFVVPADEQYAGLTARATPDIELPEGTRALPSFFSSTEDAPSILGSGFKIDNDVKAGIDYINRPKFAPDPDYNPAEDPNVKPFESLYLDNFVGSQSADESQSIISRIREEETAQDTLARSGWKGLLARVAAGTLSPTVLVPVAGWLGISAKLGRAGLATVRGAEGAALTAGAVAAQEGILQATQETRTFDESVWNIAGAAVIGGVLGGGIGLLTRPAVDDLTRRVGDEFLGRRPPEGIEAGAAVADASRGSGEMKGSFGVARVLKPITPGLRTQQSELKATRNTVRDLVKGEALKENEQGIPTSVGGSVEAQVDIAHGPMIDVFEKNRSLYSTYFFGKRVPFPIAATGVTRLIGAGRGRMSYYEFTQAVSEAALHGDTHIIPEVAEAARYRRANLVNPLRDEAMNVIPGFRELVEAGSADQSYLTRMWNRIAVRAGRNELRGILARHFRAERDAAVNVIEDAEMRAGVTDEMAAAATRDDFARLTDDEIDALSDEVIDNILGQSPGRIAMPGEFNIGVRGPLKERALRRLPSTAVRQFVERDAEVIDRAYTKSMATDIGLTKKFGSVDLKEQLQKIRDEANAASIGKPPKEVARIQKAAEADTRDILALRDIIRGTYKLPDNVDGLLHRGLTVWKSWNLLTSLGMMTVSSISDVGKPVFVHGLTRVLGTAFNPLVHGLGTIKLAAKEAKLALAGVDMINNSRMLSFAEMVDEYGRGSVFERGVNAGTKAFSFATLMAPWNAFFKQFSGIIAQTRALQAVENVVAGRATTKEISYLAEGGIDANLAEMISRQFNQNGIRDGSVWSANTQAWQGIQGKRAKEALRALVNRDVDRTIVTQTAGDRPLMSRGDLGSVIFQFQSFAMSSVQKTLISGLQQRDMAILNGTILMLATGALSYYLKSVLGGYEVSDDPRVWAYEAVDNSGVLAVLMNANHALEKWTDDQVGLSALTGQPARRYVNVNALGSIFGPSVGKISDIKDVFSSTVGGEFTASDIHKLRKMVPLQNLFWMRRAFNVLEEGTIDAMGIPARKPRN